MQVALFCICERLISASTLSYRLARPVRCPRQLFAFMP